MLDDLLALLGKDERALLRLSTLFQLPVPVAVFAILADELALEAGKPPGRRLLALGLWDAFEDAIEPRKTAVAVNPLVRPKLGALAEGDAALAAKLVLPGLFAGWGGEKGRRPQVLDHELAQLAVRCEQADVLQATAQRGVGWLENEFFYREAATLARRAVRILDAQMAPVPLGLLRVAGERCQQIGETDEARGYYGRALKRLEKAPPPETPAEIEERAALLLMHGRLLRDTGELGEALRYFEDARKLLASDARFQREQIVVQGDIADILQSRGELEEALRIRREEQLPVFERLGDVRSRAVTIFRIAKVNLQQGNYQDASNDLVEVYQIASKLGDLEGIIYVGIDLGQLLFMAGEKDQGAAILNRSLEGLLKLGRESQAQQVQALIEQIIKDQQE